MKQLLDNLIIGEKPSFFALQTLKENNIDYIVSLLEKEKNIEQENFCKILKIKCINYPIKNTSHKYWSAEEIITISKNVNNLLLNNKSIYLHCFAGIHRTGSITIGILRLNGYKKDQIIQYFRKVRPVIIEEIGIDRFNWVYGLF